MLPGAARGGCFQPGMRSAGFEGAVSRWRSSREVKQADVCAQWPWGWEERGHVMTLATWQMRDSKLICLLEAAGGPPDTLTNYRATWLKRPRVKRGGDDLCQTPAAPALRQRLTHETAPSWPCNHHPPTQHLTRQPPTSNSLHQDHEGRLLHQPARQPHFLHKSGEGKRYSQAHTQKGGHVTLLSSCAAEASRKVC